VPRPERGREDLHDADDRLHLPGGWRHAAGARHGPDHPGRPDQCSPGCGAAAGRAGRGAHRRPEHRRVRPLLRHLPRRAAPPLGSAAGIRPANREGRRQGGHPLRRDEAAADHRPGADQRPEHPAPGRADHRAGPAGPAHPLGPAVPPQARGRHAGTDHPLHGRGRTALRPAGGDGSRPDRGARLPAGADPHLCLPGGAGGALRRGRPRPEGRRRGRCGRPGGGARRPAAALHPRRRRRPGRAHRPGRAPAVHAGAPRLPGGRVPASDRPEPGRMSAPATTREGDVRTRAGSAVGGGWRSVTAYWLTVYRRIWKSTVISSVLAPLLYLAGMGYGLGAIIDAPGRTAVPGVAYVGFVATGLVAAQTMMTSVAETTYNVFGAIKWQRTYHAMLASPLRVVDLVRGHVAYLALRLLMVSTAFALVALALGAMRGPAALLTIPIAVLGGLAFGLPVYAYTAGTASDEGFNML